MYVDALDFLCPRGMARDDGESQEQRWNLSALHMPPALARFRSALTDREQLPGESWMTQSGGWFGPMQVWSLANDQRSAPLHRPEILIQPGQ
jgi:hypothetical protein